MADPAPDTVFAKSEKGTEEIRGRTVKLPREAGLVFLSIDGRTSVADLLPRSGMPAPQFYRTLDLLVADGYIEAVTPGSPTEKAFRPPRLDRARLSSRSRQIADALEIEDLVPRGDVSERARELKARVEAELRARDVAAAATQSLEPPADALPTLELGESTATPIDSMGRDDRGETRFAKPEGTPGANPEITDPIGDRTAYDVLAEGAQARRTAQDAMRAQARLDHTRGQVERANAAHRVGLFKRAGVVLLVLILALPVVALLLLQFMPLTSWLPQAQQALSERLEQPVRLETVRYVLLPTPRVILQGVAIGPNSEIRAERIEARASPFELFARPKRFRTIDVKNAVIAPAMLATLPSWLSDRGTSDVRIGIVQLSNVRIDVAAGAIAPFDGDVAFDANGRVEQAVLANDHLKMRLSPEAGGAALAIDATEWTVPFGPSLPFSYFTATGFLNERELAIHEFTGRVAGGYLQANGTLRWPGPLVVQGTFALHNVRLEEFLPALTHHVSARGILEANGRYEMRAESADALLESTRVDAAFRVSRGELENLDLLRGFNSPGASASRGGRTPFEKVTGTFHLSPAGYQYRQVQLSSGPFNAHGTIDVARSGKLSGRLNAELVVGTHVAARSSFEVAGTVGDPVLRR